MKITAKFKIGGLPCCCASLAVAAAGRHTGDERVVLQSVITIVQEL